MARAPYATIVDRFRHIDGSLSRVELDLVPAAGAPSARIGVRFYACWEHPAFLAARAAGAPWGFAFDEAAERELIIDAIEPRWAELGTDRSAIDMAFRTDAPCLWRFDATAAILCNTEVDTRALHTRLRARGEAGAAAARYVTPFPAHRAPYALTALPASAYGLIHDELVAMGVEVFCPQVPAPRPPLVALLIGDLTLIARDFVVDVPEFEHRAEWFAPPTAGPL
jgi:hypothetical protein